MAVHVIIIRRDLFLASDRTQLRGGRNDSEPDYTQTHGRNLAVTKWRHHTPLGDGLSQLLTDSVIWGFTLCRVVEIPSEVGWRWVAGVSVTGSS